MRPIGELDESALPDGGRIVADASPRSGMRLARFDAASRESATLELPYPSAGFGGGGWVFSPSGKLLILHYYSGQSEETFALIDLSNGGLRSMASPAYEFGEDASYAFSPAEDFVVVALPRPGGEWWTAWKEDGLEPAEDGVGVLPFATLRLCSTDSGHIRRTELELAPAVPRPIQTGKYDSDLDPQLSANLEVSLQLPWGRVTLDLSKRPSRIRVPYPPTPTGPSAA